MYGAGSGEGVAPNGCVGRAAGSGRRCKAQPPPLGGDEPTLTEAMMARLRPLRGRLGKREAPPKGWILLGGAVALAGVTAS